MIHLLRKKIASVFFKSSSGLAEIPLLIGLLLMAIAVPAATKLVQNNQDTRNLAAYCVAEGGTYANGSTCCDGLTPQNCTGSGAYATCICKKPATNPTATPATRQCTVRTCGSGKCNSSTVTINSSSDCPASNCVNDASCTIATLTPTRVPTTAPVCTVNSLKCDGNNLMVCSQANMSTNVYWTLKEACKYGCDSVSSVANCRACIKDGNRTASASYCCNWVTHTTPGTSETICGPAPTATPTVTPIRTTPTSSACSPLNAYKCTGSNLYHCTQANMSTNQFWTFVKTCSTSCNASIGDCNLASCPSGSTARYGISDCGSGYDKTGTIAGGICCRQASVGNTCQYNGAVGVCRTPCNSGETDVGQSNCSSPSSRCCIPKTSTPTPTPTLPSSCPSGSTARYGISDCGSGYERTGTIAGGICCKALAPTPTLAGSCPSGSTARYGISDCGSGYERTGTIAGGICCKQINLTPTPTSGSVRLPTATPTSSGGVRTPTATPTSGSVGSCREECPGTTNTNGYSQSVLRSCTPADSDGTAVESICDRAGRVESCGGVPFCCPVANGVWSTNMSACSTLPSRCTQCSNDPTAKGRGDADCNGATAINDASIWRAEFIEGQLGTVSRSTWKADFDCDGKVTINDISIWRTNFINGL